MLTLTQQNSACAPLFHWWRQRALCNCIAVQLNHSAFAHESCFDTTFCGQHRTNTLTVELDNTVVQQCSFPDGTITIIHYNLWKHFTLPINCWRRRMTNKFRPQSDTHRNRHTRRAFQNSTMRRRRPAVSKMLIIAIYMYQLHSPFQRETGTKPIESAQHTLVLLNHRYSSSLCVYA